MQFVINSKVQVIVLGFTAVIRLVISSFWLRYVIKMENSDILISCLSKLSVIEMEISDISRMFQNCSLKETTNPEYIEKFISELYPEWTSLLDSFWTLLL